MAKLVFDIETAGENFDEFDETTQKALTKWINQSYREGTSDYEAAISKVKNDTVFSPLTSQVVAIGVFDCEKEKGVVYFQAPGEKISGFEEDNFIFKPTTEKEMLEGFWYGAENYSEFISFNGRAFDIPFMMIRSAINGIRPTKNLVGARYLYQHPDGAVHVDLYEQLNFYGAMRKGGSLHMYTRAFGIKSPKSEGVAGDDVTRLFNEGKFLDIARYSARDVIATRELYERWNSYLRF